MHYGNAKRASGKGKIWNWPWVRMALLAATVLCAGGCGPFTVLNAVTPDAVARSHVDIAYGSDPRQKMDWYYPQGTSKGVVVFYYGGGWTRGNREDYRFVTGLFNRAGYEVVLPDYRLYPNVQFPTFVEDAASAFAAVLERTDSECVFVAGHSAGAHIAAMLHFDETYLEQADAARRPSAMIGLSGPYDFLPLTSDRLRRIFPEESRDASQPVHFVDGGEAPVLLVQGTDDDTVWLRNTLRMTAKIQEHGGKVEPIILEGVGHRATVLALSRSFRFMADVALPLKSFLDTQAEQCSTPRSRDAG